MVYCNIICVSCISEYLISIWVVEVAVMLVPITLCYDVTALQLGNFLRSVGKRGVQRVRQLIYLHSIFA